MPDAHEQEGVESALAQARQTIARQEEDIERLKRRIGDEHLADDLRQALTQASAAGIIGSPVTHARLLEMIVETAASVIGARAASLFLVDYESQQLTFEVALGEKAEEVKHLTVPLGHGIAGLVAVSGQPMAISDASNDPRQASDIARRVGYTPGTILCVPLFYGDSVIGVLEMLDKEGAPSFTPGDMALLGLFANQAGVAIEQSRMHRDLTALVEAMLKSLGTEEGETSGLRDKAGAFARSLEGSPAYREAADLAHLVQEIAWRGEKEARLCRDILTRVADYLNSREELSDSGAF